MGTSTVITLRLVAVVAQNLITRRPPFFTKPGIEVYAPVPQSLAMLAAATVNVIYPEESSLGLTTTEASPTVVFDALYPEALSCLLLAL